MEDDSNKKRFRIATSSSVMGLSLSGNSIATLNRRCQDGVNDTGEVFNPFSPWRVLSLQHYSDWESDIDFHHQREDYLKGLKRSL